MSISMKRPSINSDQDLKEPLFSSSFTNSVPEDLEFFYPDVEHHLHTQGILLEDEQSDRNANVYRASDFSKEIRVSRGIKYHSKEILNYDSSRLGTWRVFLTTFAKGSAFRDYHVYIQVLLNCVLSLVFFAIVDPIGDDENATEHYKDLDKYIGFLHTLVTFFLSFYASFAANRWWAMRNDCIGNLWGSMDDLCLQLAVYFPLTTPEHRKVKSTILRWAVASHELCYMQANNDNNLTSLIDCKLLRSREVKLLKNEPSKPQCVWVWIASYLSHLAYGEGVKNRLPYPVMTLPKLHTLCTKARGAIGQLFAYTDTQVPFQYVQIMSWMVAFCNICQALISALLFKIALDEEDYFRFGLEVAYLIFYPLFYLSILSMSDSMLNPIMNKRYASMLPRKAFSYYMMAENEAFFRSGERPPYGEPPIWEDQGSQTDPNAGNVALFRATEH